MENSLIPTHRLKEATKGLIVGKAPSIVQYQETDNVNENKPPILNMYGGSLIVGRPPCIGRRMPDLPPIIVPDGVRPQVTQVESKKDKLKRLKLQCGVRDHKKSKKKGGKKKK